MRRLDLLKCQWGSREGGYGGCWSRVREDRSGKSGGGQCDGASGLPNWVYGSRLLPFPRARKTGDLASGVCRTDSNFFGNLEFSQAKTYRGLDVAFSCQELEFVQVSRCVCGEGVKEIVCAQNMWYLQVVVEAT